jgi:S-adenosylmethionine synthetase
MPRVEVRPAPRPVVAERAFELCEHKGIGHPDSIADGACEAAAVALARTGLMHLGRVAHFNVDKGLLIAGRSRPRFGGGEVTAPMRLILCGRAASPAPGLDAGTVVAKAARDYLARTLHTGAEHFEIESQVRDGSVALARVYGGGVARANDTSFGVGHAPYSPLETRVLALAATLRSAAFRDAVPAAGDDFKIMGVRRGDAFDFTVALALIGRHVAGTGAYFALKDAIAAHLLGTLGVGCTLRLNALDDAAARDETGVYLTVTGLSAEMGDDGQVGRGNRVNGLITPGRPMSLEAAAGKNPVGHVGKVYNVLAHDVARAVCTALPELREANVYLLGTIGAPLAEPALAVVEVAARGGLAPDLARRVRAVAGAQIAAVGDLAQRLARGEFAVF